MISKAEKAKAAVKIMGGIRNAHSCTGPERNKGLANGKALGMIELAWELKMITTEQSTEYKSELYQVKETGN